MNPTSRQILLGLGATTLTAFIVLACGSGDESQFGDGKADGSGTDIDGSFVGDGAKPDGGDPFANDPPPPWCGPAGQPVPPRPGGTAECPDDKNKPGCGCDELGKEATCWTGLRANRNLGICKDGKTKCNQVNENLKTWGPCEGQVLPQAGATKGAPACKCFSAGQWKLSNLSPCFITYSGANAGTYGVSTVIDGSGANGLPAGQADCPDIPQASSPPPAVPSSIWSTSTLKVDCAGHFKLCLRIRAGDFKAPSTNDCILTEVCTEADYVKENVEQPWPDLPGWTGKTKECAEKWNATPDTQSAGYAEMIVKGKSVRCDAIDDGNGGDLVFNRVQYCPAICRTNPGTPECQACQQAGSGGF